MAQEPRRIRRRTNTLLRWEVSIVKAMQCRGGFGNDQDILAYFTRPTRSINHRLIGQIRRGDVHARTRIASDQELDQFISAWPQIDFDTGLHVINDERIIKAREAMLMAVQGYNNPKLYFRSEVFIVVACIAWTYLLHAYFETQGIEIRYTEPGEGDEVKFSKTKYGGYKYWDLQKCLDEARSPLEAGERKNLEFLLMIRHEIEHQMTTSIDDLISAKLQACCLNFNSAIKRLFGETFGLDSELSFALQFSSLSPTQTRELMRQQALPAHIEAARLAFESPMSAEEYADPKYAYRVFYVPYAGGSKNQADEVLKFVKPGTDESEEIRQIALKETEKKKYRAGQICALMHGEGFPGFRTYDHWQLWKKLDAKAADKGYGVETNTDGWRWYETWLNAVRQHCEENREKYR